MGHITQFARRHLALLFILAAVGLVTVVWGVDALGSAGGVFVAGAVLATDEQIRYLVKTGLLDAQGGLMRKFVAKTANYQIVAPTSTLGDPSGTCFTNRGAGGAVTFTLPAITVALAGTVYEFFGVAGQNITVAAAAGTVVTFNNAAATSVTSSTAGQLIGAHFRAECDGTSWHIVGDRIGVTYTVA